MNIAIVKSSELGVNCWLRFLGHECKGLETCTKTATECPRIEEILKKE